MNRILLSALVFGALAVGWLMFGIALTWWCLFYATDCNDDAIDLALYVAAGVGLVVFGGFLLWIRKKDER